MTISFKEAVHSILVMEAGDVDGGNDSLRFETIQRLADNIELRHSVDIAALEERLTAQAGRLAREINVNARLRKNLRDAQKIQEGTQRKVARQRRDIERQMEYIKRADAEIQQLRRDRPPPIVEQITAEQRRKNRINGAKALAFDLWSEQLELIVTDAPTVDIEAITQRLNAAINYAHALEVRPS